MFKKVTERANHYFKQLSFRTKLTISIIVILLAFGITLSFLIGKFASRSMLEEKQAKAVSLSVMLASRAIEPILSYDFLSLKNLTDETFRLNKDISYAFILNRDLEVLVHTFNEGFPLGLIEANTTKYKEPYKIQLIYTGTELIYDIATPILISDRSIGTIRLGISHKEAEIVVDRLRWTIYFIIALGIATGALSAAWLSKTVTQRIKTLHNAAREVIKGNLDAHANQEALPHCWQIKECTNRDCPAFKDEIRKCWYLAGTKCPECREGIIWDKFDRCQQCNVYKKNAGDEIQELADFFDIMVFTLKDRIDTLSKTEEDLQQQKELLRMILDVIPDYVSLQDLSMRYIAVNKSFCALLGKKEEDILYKTDSDIMPPEQSNKNTSDNQLVIKTATKISGEFQMSYNDSIRWFHIVRMPVINTRGEMTGILCSSRDITEIREIHDRLAKAQHMESIGQLAAGVAHEINTPLGIILGHTQLMLEDFPKGTEPHDNLLTIEKYTRVCKKIVSDLLHFSRHTESIKKILSINELIEQVISVIEHTYSINRIAIRKSFSKNLPPIYGDTDKLEQVFMNLFRNAFDAIGSDGTIWVSTGLDKTHNMVVATIADSGCGINPKNRDRIFNPFFSTKSVGKGTGLGLSVTLGIINDHKGSIEFESPPTTVFPWMDKKDMPEKGTMFIIKLPSDTENPQKEVRDGKDSSSR